MKSGLRGNTELVSAGGWTGGGIGGNPDLKLAETGGREGNDDCLRRGGGLGTPLVVLWL